MKISELIMRPVDQEFPITAGISVDNILLNRKRPRRHTISIKLL